MAGTTPSATTLPDRGLIRIGGAEARDFLQGLVTHDVALLGEGRPLWAGLLSAQGKALFEFILWADGPEDVLIDCERDQADALARRLALYRLRRALTIAREEGLAVHWAPDDDRGVPDPRLAALGRRWLAPAADTAEGWTAHRLAHGVAEGVAEIGQDRTLWLEANAAELNGVSFTKGCYVGQENTARMNWRQKVNRRLIAVRAGADPGDGAVWHPALGIAVMRLRVAAIGATPGAIVPEWLAGVIG